MKFLKGQNGILVGVQGLSLVLEQKIDELPENYDYSSFDEKDRLCKNSAGEHGVPSFDGTFVGPRAYGLYLNAFEGKWSMNDAFLLFCTESEYPDTRREVMEMEREIW